MISVTQITLVQNKGIAEDVRYFDRRSRRGGPSRRQVTLIEQEQIAAHASALALPEIASGRVRANIETTGISWSECIGKEVRIGTAVIRVLEPRTPCSKMDAVAPGLRKLMDRGRQGVLAQVVASGIVRLGDQITIPCGITPFLGTITTPSRT
jgi:MOSC domain-containing protein YiiM